MASSKAVSTDDRSGWANDALPTGYKAVLANEPQAVLTTLVQGLGRVLALRDVGYEGMFYISQVTDYLEQDNPLPSAQRILLVKQLFAFILLPDVDVAVQSIAASALTRLIKKESLYDLPLELPWRPVVDLVQRLYFGAKRGRLEHPSVKHHPPAIPIPGVITPRDPSTPVPDAWVRDHGVAASPLAVAGATASTASSDLSSALSSSALTLHARYHLSNLMSMLRRARRFFPASATQEILDEFRPLLHPHDTSKHVAVAWLTQLLPVHHADQHLLWLDEMMAVWDWCDNLPDMDTLFLSLFARLARANVGRVAWEPYHALMFTRFLNTFDIPVGTSGSEHVYSYSLDEDASHLAATFIGSSSTRIFAIADLIVYSLTPASMPHIRQLMRALTPYYHPSNHGRWSDNLASLLKSLSNVFVERIGLERHDHVRARLPPQHHLTAKQIADFIAVLQPLVMQSLHTKSIALVGAASMSLKYLASVDPTLCVPALMERVYPALTTLTETHTTLAALATLGTMAGTLFRWGKWAEGPGHLANVLQLSLPGIDPIDPLKTFATLQLYQAVLSFVPLVQGTSAGDAPGEADALSATTYLGDWACELLDRVFLLFEHQLESKKVGTGASQWTSSGGSITNYVEAIAALLFMQMSRPLYTRCITRLLTLVTDDLRVNAVKQVALLCGAASAPDPPQALKLFVPRCLQRIRAELEPELLARVAAGLASDTLGDDEPIPRSSELTLVWWLRILGQVVRRGGTALLPYEKDITALLRDTLHLPSKPVRKLAGKLLRYSLRSCLMTRLVEARSHPPSVWNSAEFQASPWRFWGRAGDISQLEQAWAEPTPATVAMAERLIAEFVLRPLADTWPLLQDAPAVPQDVAACATPGAGKHSKPLSRHRLWHALQCVRNGVRGANILFPEIDEADDAVHPAASPHRSYPTLPDTRPQILRPTASPGMRRVRLRIAQWLHHVYVHLEAKAKDDVQLFKLVVKVGYVFMSQRGARATTHYQARRTYQHVKRLLRDRAGPSKAHPRWLLLGRATTQLSGRLVAYAQVLPSHAAYLALIQDAFAMSTREYAAVRRKAQSVLLSQLRRVPAAPHVILPQALAILSNRASPEHAVTGACYLLNSQALLTWILRSWRYESEFLRALVVASVFDKPTIQERVQRMFSSFSYNARYLPIRMQPPPGHGKPLSDVFPDLRAPDAVTPDEVKAAALRIKRAGTRRDDSFNSLVAFLHAQLTATPPMHWRYFAIALGCLGFLLRRRDRPYPVAMYEFLHQCMLHDMPSVRSIAMHSLVFAQWRMKPVRARINSAPLPGDRVTAADWDALNATTLNAGRYDGAVFIDRNGYGFYCQPKNAWHYAPLTQPARQTISASQAQRVTAQLTKPEFWSRWTSLYVDLQVTGREHFSRTGMQYIKGATQLAGPALLPAVRASLVDLVSKPDQASCQVVAAEITAGLIRGSKHWRYTDRAALFAWLIPDVLAKARADTPPEIARFYIIALHYAVGDHDPRRYHWLLDWLLSDVLTGVTSLETAKRVPFLDPVLGETNWRGRARAVALLQQLEPMLDHSYQQVRQSVGKLAARIVSMLWVPARDAKTQRYQANTAHPVDPAVQQHLQALLARLEAASDALRTYNRQQDAAVAASADGASSRRRRSSGGGGGGVAVDPMVIKVRNVRQTALYHASSMMQGPSTPTLAAYLLRVLPPMLGMHDDHDKDLRRQLRSTMWYVARIKVAQSQLAPLLTLVQNAGQSSQWHVRLAVLPFLQVSVFRHAAMMAAADRERVNTLLNQLLVDPQLEVRSLAAISLSGLLRSTADDAMYQALAKRYGELADTALPRARSHSRTGGDSGDRSRRRHSSTSTRARSSALIQRHGGVLGLAAIINAFPYDVPDWMPAVMVELAKHHRDPMPVRESVRKTFADFWSTHSDQWFMHKLKFDEDQRATVTELLVSPSYYA